MTRKLTPALATVLVLTIGYGAMLAVNLPGHLSFDSIVQLHEGRLHVRDTWAPAIYGAVLGAFDRLLPGTALYVAASGLLFFGSLASLILLRPKTSWAAVLVALALVCSPLVLIYQGIVWKDVLFANFAVAGCICLAHAAKAWPRLMLRWAWLAAALALLGLAGLVRQNGLLVAVTAALALGWTARGRGWRMALVWGLGGLAAVVAVSHVLSVAVEPTPTSAAEATTKGVRILRRYDVVAAVARDPHVKLEAMTRANAAATAVIRADAAKFYTAQRVDTLGIDSSVGQALREIEPKAIEADWRAIVTERPDLYIHDRLGIFHWLLAPPELERCLPVFIGVDGPADKLAALKIAPRRSPADEALHRYAKFFYPTPLYSHLTYGALALLTALGLLIRRDPADIPIAALMLGAVGFAASFLVISLACDFRYLYLLDLAGMTGLFYLALDPRLRRRG